MDLSFDASYRRWQEEQARRLGMPIDQYQSLTSRPADAGGYAPVPEIDPGVVEIKVRDNPAGRVIGGLLGGVQEITDPEAWRSAPSTLVEGGKAIYRGAKNYIANNTPAEMVGDVVRVGKAIGQSMLDDPVYTTVSMTPVVGDVMQAGDLRNARKEVEAAKRSGDPKRAAVAEGIAGLALAGLLLPGAITKGVGGSATDAVVSSADDMARAAAKGADTAPAVLRGTDRLPDMVQAGVNAPKIAPTRGGVKVELEDMLRNQSPDLVKKVDTYRAQSPAFDHASRYMLPEELSAVTRSPAGPANVEMYLNGMPDTADLAAVAKLGEPKIGWYNASTRAIDEMFGPDAPRFTALLAATSPRTSVEGNLTNALNIWNNWDAAGRPTDPAEIVKTMGQSVQGKNAEKSVLDAWVNNTVAALGATDEALAGFTLSGPKVHSFYKNLTGDMNYGTQDAWMAAGLDVDPATMKINPNLKKGDPGWSPSYVAMNARTREAGDMMGYRPGETQEAIWSVLQPTLEGAKSRRMTPTEFFDQGHLTADVVRGVPDFATLLRDPRFQPVAESIVARNGRALPSQYPWGEAALPPMSDAEVAGARRVFGVLDQLQATRKATSDNVRLVGSKKPGERVAMNINVEAAPGKATGHRPDYFEMSPSQQDVFSSNALAKFTDTSGRNVVTRSLWPDDSGYPSAARGGYMNSEGKMEFNKGTSLPVVGRLENGVVSADDMTKLDAATTLYGGLLAQEGVPGNVFLPDPQGPNASIRMKKPITASQFKEVTSLLGDAPAGVVDTGPYAHLMSFDPSQYSVPDQVAARAAKTLGVKPDQVRNTRNIGTYTDLTDEWKAGEGSGAVAGKMVDKLNRLALTDFERLDNANLRRAAGDLYDMGEKAAKQGKIVRSDYQNMLRIVSTRGLKGLRDAVGKKEFLPAIAAIGLAPVLMRAYSEDGNEPS